MTYLKNYFFIDTRELRLLPEGAPIRQKAQQILSDAKAFNESVSSVGNRWQALASVYRAPEQDLVLRAMDTPVLQAENHLESVRVFHDAVDRFGTELDEIHAAVSDLDRTTEAAYDDWLLRLDELNAEGASTATKEAARAEAIAPLESRLQEIKDRYEQARRACVHSLGTISRSSTNVISSYPSSIMDLTATGREDAIAAFDKASAPGASPADIKAFYAILLTAGPDLMNELGSRPGAASFVAGMSTQEEMQFWNKLNLAQQGALLAALPGLVGNLDGAPYATRNIANRQLLEVLQRELDNTVLNSGSTGTDYEAVAIREAALDSLREALAHDERYLISLDPRAAAPLAQVASGNPDTARNITYLVPGMNSSSMDAASMAVQADELRRRQGKEGIYGNDTAVIAYMGYESPVLGTVASEESAEIGAPVFADALDGIYITRSAAGTAPEVSVIAHSYGTTMSSIALGMTDYPVSSVVLVASAGLPEGIGVTDLHVDPGPDGQPEVYVTLAEADNVAWMGWTAGQRTNPADTDDLWGGRIFSSEAATVDGTEYKAVSDHDFRLYMGNDALSMKIMALITGGSREEALELIRATQK